jgi:arylsulfatase A-like enzyme
MRAVLAIGLVVASALAACSRGGGTADEVACALRGAAPSPRPPVVLVVNDTMRRDRLGVYGGKARTPAFDALARDGLRFDHAYSQAPWTRPAIATLLTGLNPSQHGVGMERGEERKTPRAVAPEFATLAELLRDAGYRTAAFVSNPWMEERFGFDQGFEVYDVSFARWGAGEGGPKLDGAAVSDKALAWLDTIPADAPWFLYVHYLDSHRPYPALTLGDLEAQRERVSAPPRAPETDAVREELRGVVRVLGTRGAPLVEPRVAMAEIAYEKGIERFDTALGRLLAGIERRPDGARAAVIVTSDHGEAFWDRGYGNHGRGLHDDELAIPLAMRLPGVTGPPDGVACLTGLVDVVPTLCAYLGIACAPDLAGQSLLAPVPRRRWMVSEAVGTAPRHRAIRDARWKLIWQPDGAPDGPRANAYSLYDVAADPGETRDLVASEDPAVRETLAALTAALATAGPEQPLHAAPSVPIERPVEERLRALGYVD